MAGSKSVVIAALIANGAIAVLKFFAFLASGSPSMLSEAYHSVSDTGNQVFLLIGIRYSAREATQTHPFGYGKAQFFYSFLVSVLLFGIAGWESFKHGYSALTSHGGHGGGPREVVIAGIDFTALVPLSTFQLSVGVLSAAIVFETWALAKANGELQRQIETYDWSGIREAFRETSDVTTLTAFTEDAVALGGAVIALVGIVLTRVTGVEAFDAATALLIGLLLMGFALALAWQNKRLLLGESLSPGREDALRAAAADTDGVVHVDALRTMFVGASQVLVTADVSFDPDLDTAGVDAATTAVESALRETDDRVSIVYVEAEG
ncbi:cation diffusion facilitator family transporter [Halobaculum sp. MBLA0147]|uniref:cation diffusion facilitator family transporter n=1 Tax=Halobaculum sp. MBLA0147 TaxID=3079934 RepID=UPI0035245E28